MDYFPTDLPYQPPTQPLSPSEIYHAWKRAKVVLPKGPPIPMELVWEDELMWYDILVWKERDGQHL